MSFAYFYEMSPRKLSLITCEDSSLKQSLEKRYPGLCGEVRAVTEAGGCEDNIWTKAGLGEDGERIDRLEETILLYMRENTAVINIFIKQPYCELIIQDRYITWYLTMIIITNDSVKC